MQGMHLAESGTGRISDHHTGMPGGCPNHYTIVLSDTVVNALVSVCV